MPGGSPTLRICEIGGRVRLGLEGFGHVEGPTLQEAADVLVAIRGHADEGDVHAVVLDAQTVPFVYVTAAEMLTRLQNELASLGVALLLARVGGQVRDVLRLRSGSTPQSSTKETP